MLALFNRLVGQLPPIDPAVTEGRYDDILAVCAANAPHPPSAAPAAGGGPAIA